MSNDLKNQIIQLGETLASERNAAYDLWTHLPSHVAAQAAHGDYAGEVMPSVRDIMVEAALFIGHKSKAWGSRLTLEDIEDAGELYQCPCGEHHEHTILWGEQAEIVPALKDKTTLALYGFEVHLQGVPAIPFDIRAVLNSAKTTEQVRTRCEARIKGVSVEDDVEVVAAILNAVFTDKQAFTAWIHAQLAPASSDAEDKAAVLEMALNECFCVIKDAIDGRVPAVPNKLQWVHDRVTEIKKQVEG